MLSRIRMMMTHQQGDIPPVGGRFVKTLISSGTQYIVTDFYPDSETVFTFKIYEEAVNSLYENYYGAAGYEFRLQRNASANNQFTMNLYGISTKYFSLVLSGNHTIIADCHNAVFKIDETAIATGTPLEIYTISSYPLLLFAIGKNTSNPTTGDVPGVFKLYGATVCQNGVLTHNYRPAIDKSGTPCLYDTIEKRSFYNAGTGEFDYDE